MSNLILPHTDRRSAKASGGFTKPYESYGEGF
jgi:hypothetical protein